MGYLKLIADRYRWGEKKFLYFLPQYRFIYHKRKCEFYKKNFLPFYFIHRLIYQHLKIKYLMDIPASLEIGMGFKIEHIGNITINPRAKIGKNCTILNGVLIGQQNRGKNKGFPKIGDKVWIGTNSIL